MAGKAGAKHGVNHHWVLGEGPEEKDFTRGELRLAAEIALASSAQKLAMPGSVLDRGYSILREVARS